MTDSEKRVSDILESLDGIQRAEPDQKIFDRFTISRKSGKVISMGMSRRQLIGIAASLTILAGLNFAICYRYSHSNKDRISGRSPFAKEYFDFTRSIDF